VVRVPLVATTPVQAQLPLAVQEVASVLDQVIAELAPDVIVEGLNAIVTVGTGVAAAATRVPMPINVMMSISGHAARQCDATILVVVIIPPSLRIPLRAYIHYRVFGRKRRERQKNILKNRDGKERDLALLLCKGAGANSELLVGGGV
jgi:hypothetical protein